MMFIAIAAGFVQFLVSAECDIFRREHSEVYQDMTQPLSHYYIASSHNTYVCTVTSDTLECTNQLVIH